MEQYLWLILLAFIIGTYGTLIGAGGGFVLLPVLLLLYPDESPQIIAGISLAVIFFNALSGSLAYAWMRRIDYKSGLLFAVAAAPGAILGAFSTPCVSRRFFDAACGILMITASIFLLSCSTKEKKTPGRKRSCRITINLVEKNGTAYTFSYNPTAAVGLSCLVGYISSFLGIGGGIIHVPVLVRLLNFPVHIATATSHFILAITALTGTVVHIATGSFSHGIRRTTALAVGVLLGAQVGAILSNRVQGSWITRGLAVALGFVGARILIMAL